MHVVIVAMIIQRYNLVSHNSFLQQCTATKPKHIRNAVTFLHIFHKPQDRPQT